MEKIHIKVCLGTTCFVTGAGNLQKLMEIIPEKYPDTVDVIGVPCLGLCSIDCKNSRAPYVKVNDDVIHNATTEKVIEFVDNILNNQN